jgi:hypothetical protein
MWNVSHDPAGGMIYAIDDLDHLRARIDGWSQTD